MGAAPVGIAADGRLLTDRRSAIVAGWHGASQESGGRTAARGRPEGRASSLGKEARLRNARTG